MKNRRPRRRRPPKGGPTWTTQLLENALASAERADPFSSPPTMRYKAKRCRRIARLCGRCGRCALVLVALFLLTRIASHISIPSKLTRVRLRGRGIPGAPPRPRSGSQRAATATPAAATEPPSVAAVAATGPLGRYVTAVPVRALPVLVVAHRRPKTFDLTLRSLLRVHGVAVENVYVVQDGAMAAVKAVAMRHGILVSHFHQRSGPRGAVAKEKRIAAHYKYALDWTFRAIPHDVPAIIVAEDDLLFAPDFMAYFRAVAPLLESDETVWSASAWNDNAFVHNVDVATGATELRRTTHFPGLSWLLPRALWVDQLEAAWPAEHWVSFFDIFPFIV